MDARPSFTCQKENPKYIRFQIIKSVCRCVDWCEGNERGDGSFGGGEVLGLVADGGGVEVEGEGGWFGLRGDE